MVAEAQKVRQRMLDDLARRRKQLRQQIEQLQAGRERLLTAYEVVRETLDVATEELQVALPEAKLAAETASLKAADDDEETFAAEIDEAVAAGANEAEVECARLLDYYGIAWEYEPTSFPLETDEEGRVVEAFTPDFFLPEQELYLEVTVMKQSLVTRKNRKIRKFRERYPDIKVKLFTRRDFERLGQKYGLNLVT